MENLIAFDIETTSLCEKTTEIVGIGVYSEKGHKFIYKPTKEQFVKLLEQIGDRKLIMQNGVFDCSCIYHYYGIDIREKLAHDTMLLAHTLGRDMELNLDYLSEQYLGEKKIEIDKPHHELTESEMKEYCLRDVELTYKLCEKLLNISELPMKLYTNEVMPLYREVTIPMKYKGLYVHTKYFTKLVKDLEISSKHKEFLINEEIKDKIGNIKEKILDQTYKTSKNSRFGKLCVQLYGTLDLDRSTELMLKTHLWLTDFPDKPFIFNINSSDQLAWLLFKIYKQRIEKRSKNTNKPVVDAKILELYKHLPFIDLLLKKRKEDKLLSTYAKPILEKSVDSWVYPNMNQTGTGSGRYSSNNPNFQNLPRDDDRIKKGIIAPKGYKIVSADFSSLEPRCFAETSGCSKLIEAYRKGEDFYSRIAIDVLGLDHLSAIPTDDNFLKKVDPEKRQIVKCFALAVIYGAKAWKVSKILCISEAKAQELIDKYLEIYPELKEYMNRQENDLILNNRIVSRFDRVIYVDYANADKKSRGHMLNLAKNHPIQALAAHICNAAAIKTSRELIKQRIDGQIVSQIHDELVLYVCTDQAKKAAEILKDAMENNEITNKMEVPVLAEPAIGTNLAEVK